MKVFFMSISNNIPFFVIALALLPAQTFAAGFYLQENSVSAMGSAFSGATVNIKDASTVWFNPAGMTDLDGRQMSVGAHLIMPHSSIRNTGSTLFGNPITGSSGGNPYNPTPVPNFYYAAPINEKTWGGIGFNAPFGLASDYENSFFGRYDSIYTDLAVYNVSGSLAYEVSPRLSIGAGLDMQYADATLKNAVNGGAANDAFSELKGDSRNLGYNIGIKAKPWPKTTVGATYRSGVEHKLKGDISVTGTSGAVVPFSFAGSAKLALPDIAAVGFSHDLNDDTRFMANATWYGWSKFDEIRSRSNNGVVNSTTRQNYKNTLGISIGGEHDLNDVWTLRAGYQYDPTPTQDGFRTATTPDGNRNWFTAGATYKISPVLSLDLAAAIIHVADEQINVTRNSGTAIIRGDTSGHVEILSAAINYKF